MSRGRTPTPTGRPWGRAAALVALLLAGCTGEPGFREADPLIGGGPAAGGMARAAGTASARGPAPGEVPPLPPPTYGARPPAALAGNGSYDLRMSDTPSAGTGVGATATLQGPRPVAVDGGGGGGRIVPVAQPRLGFTPVAAVQPVAGGDSYEQLQAQLDARGVTMRRLETVGDQGEWRFICAVPQPGSPNTRRTYEGRAVGGHGLTAIRVVLEQIDRERR